MFIMLLTSCWTLLTCFGFAEPWLGGKAHLGAKMSTAAVMCRDERPRDVRPLSNALLRGSARQEGPPGRKDVHSRLFELCRRTQQPSLTFRLVGGSTFGLCPLFHLRDGGKWTEMTATQHGGTLRH
jgi:hypothetical protein